MLMLCVCSCGIYLILDMFSFMMLFDVLYLIVFLIKLDMICCNCCLFVCSIRCFVWNFGISLILVVVVIGFIVWMVELVRLMMLIVFIGWMCLFFFILLSDNRLLIRLDMCFVLFFIIDRNCLWVFVLFFVGLCRVLRNFIIVVSGVFNLWLILVIKLCCIFLVFLMVVWFMNVSMILWLLLIVSVVIVIL